MSAPAASPPPGDEALLEGPRERLLRRGGVARADVRGVIAPYRICPLGAHSDHQHGPVTGLAVDLYTQLAFAPAEDARVEIASAHYPELLRFDLSQPQDPGQGPGWTRYARGAAEALRDRLPARPVGLRAFVEGALPGGGLSSSASVVIAYLLALAHANRVLLSQAELVALGRRVENEYVGVACGILDPASIVASQRGRLLAIDTARSRWEPVAQGDGAPDARFLVVYTGRARSLAGSAFNARVEECREAARRLCALAGRRDVELLGALPDAVFDAHLDALPGPLARRARHFRSERQRVREGLDCWRRGDLEGFGARMTASCASSIHDYQTGSPELVALQEILCDTEGVLGARFSGAGFAGCGVALVRAAAAQAAAGSAARRFGERFPELAPAVRAFVVGGEDGARLV